MFSCLVLNKKNVPLQDKKRVFIYNGIKDSDSRKEANNPQKKEDYYSEITTLRGNIRKMFRYLETFI